MDFLQYGKEGINIMEPLFDIESESKGRNPYEDIGKYNDLVLRYMEKLVNLPMSPLRCEIPGKKQNLFSGVGLLADIGLKNEETTIPVKFWIRHSYTQLRDYPRLHLPKTIDNCEELYNMCSRHDIHFCVLVLNNGVLSSYWADRYDFIPFNKYNLEARWDRIDRICTPFDVQKGKLKHVGFGLINIYKQFASLVHKQGKRNKAKGVIA